MPSDAGTLKSTGDIERLQADLAHIQEALRLCGYRGNFAEIKPIHRRPGRAAPGWWIDILRKRRCPPFNAQIAVEIARTKGWYAEMTSCLRRWSFG